MDTAFIVAIITSCTTITCALIAVFTERSRRNEKKSKDAIEKAIAVDKSLTTSSAYTINRLEKIVKLDDVGSGVQIQRWYDIKANQNFNDLKIPFTFRIEGGNVNLGEPIAKELEGSSLPVELTGITIDDSKPNAKRLQGRFVLVGIFNPDAKPVSFYWEQKFEGAYLMTREKTLEAYKLSNWKQEYTASRVIVPTDNFLIEVHFPESFKTLNPPPSPVAFVGGSHAIHDFETKRIKDSFSFSDRIAKLTVSNPIIGLSYAISWMPPQVPV